MKNIYIFLSVIILLSSSCVLDPKKKSLQLEVSLVNKIQPSVVKEKTGEFYSIKLNIINNTNSKVRFWILSCWWEDNCIFNCKNIVFHYPKCYKNSLDIKEIASGGCLIYTGIIKVINNISLNNEEGFKLGFILIKENEYRKNMDFDKILLDKINKNKDIIWCDNLIFINKKFK